MSKLEKTQDRQHSVRDRRQLTITVRRGPGRSCGGTSSQSPAHTWAQSILEQLRSAEKMERVFSSEEKRQKMSMGKFLGRASNTFNRGLYNWWVRLSQLLAVAAFVTTLDVDVQNSLTEEPSCFPAFTWVIAADRDSPFPPSEVQGPPFVRPSVREFRLVHRDEAPFAVGFIKCSFRLVTPVTSDSSNVLYLLGGC
ncbi:hypothetical protein TGPRC2_311485 [Toxoplasma gondii TgCatPRC2]|uniref:Uncharacterized protein n=6 Tax=Toxoplasma gondii TaxID=5811 RepID=A0A151HKN9_TOXGO|nr:hypothetical protein TGDOM2_311485 [Toxoplasma gondii GAB2-2007-GAL-DOM2]KFG55922.1 hypothetical protein TGFOU_311485 [Toxoplasma gondii FOU]KFG65924.1 hypothetical protein TGRUB_311485 [Toxoplasma gondii RUB]KYK69935.1 hypothetical protein TGPRC2_311485 [Toxoplasma gondii TgCatPRC2]PUA91807.1 hypothetical protein TGBR9_311485 [Toxoplasma gondii TgCATBr9]RQX72517.1 hypothetical protein TGCAST_311485 [Toxoplasma gondii CAST]